jgi:hypothetical protein
VSEPDFTIVPFSDDFNIEAVFGSEADVSTDGPQVEEVSPRAPQSEAGAVHTDARRAPADHAEVIAAKAIPRDAERAALLIADLIENNVRLEWPEAVAITMRLCRAMARDPAASVHRASLEPWTIEITGNGDVQVLPGPPSGDPIVKQLGRMLRALLYETSAPAELRVLASQACFEVPIFSSVDELLSALRHFDRPGESEAIRNAFHRGVEAKFATPAPPAANPRALVRTLSWAPEPHRPPPIPPPSAVPPRRMAASTQTFIVLAIILGAAAAWGAFRAVRPQPTARAQVTASTTAPGYLPPSLPPLVARRAPTPALAAPELDSRAALGSLAFPPRPAPAHDPPPVREARPAAPIAASRPSVRNVGPPVVWLPDHSDPLRDAERRASALIAAGRVDEAEIVFDSILFKNPSYRLDSMISNSDSAAVFRRSKRLIVPAIAREHYDWAIDALQAGDVYRANSEADLAAALIADSELDTSANELRHLISDLATRARAATELEERKIYSNANADVVPPRPIGRQLPADPPAGIGNELTGRLEILVDQSGRVESVKLHTPRNSYHDRMIVSAAKAWHYAPATRNGRPVRFNIVMSINLPQS